MFRVEKLETDNAYVVKNSNNEVVSMKFKNKSQALSKAVELNAEAPATKPVEPIAKPVEVAEEIPARFVGRAVGMFLDNEGVWTVASIPFDPTTRETHGNWKLEKAGANKLEGHATFKVIAAKEILSK